MVTGTKERVEAVASASAVASLSNPTRNPCVYCSYFPGTFIMINALACVLHSVGAVVVVLVVTKSTARTSSSSALSANLWVGGYQRRTTTVDVWERTWELIRATTFFGISRGDGGDRQTNLNAFRITPWIATQSRIVCTLHQSLSVAADVATAAAAAPWGSRYGNGTLSKYQMYPLNRVLHR